MFTSMLVGSPDGKSEGSPRIHKFTFEVNPAESGLQSSLSAQFALSFEPPYDDLGSSARRHPTADSDRSSRGPHTPPLSPQSMSPCGTLSPNLLHPKSTPRPLSQASSTFLFDIHSLSPGQSLLSDAPSFLELKNLDDIYLQITPPRATSSQPIAPPSSLSYQPRPSLESTRSTSSNRGISVRQLALDLPIARSRSSSLTELIRALEDASPGWYQSLLDSALPRSASPSPLSTPASSRSSSSPSPGSLCPSDPQDSPTRKSSRTAKLGESLSQNLLFHIAALEDLAAQVRRLPPPRPRTLVPEVVDTLLFTSQKDVAVEIHATRPPLTSFPRLEPRNAILVPPSDGYLPDSFGEVSLASSPPSRSDSLRSVSSTSPQAVIANVTNHPKLAKTLGLRSTSSHRVLRPPAKPVTQPGDDRPSRTSLPPATVTPPSAALPPLPKKASQNSSKSPKSLKFNALFRRRPSMPTEPPAAPEGPIPDPHSRRAGRRAATLSTPAEHYGGGTTSVRSKSGRHFSAGASLAASHTHLPQRRVYPADSFLQM